MSARLVTTSLVPTFTMSIDESRITILQSLQGHRSDVTSCDFTVDFTLVTGSSDKTVRIWDWHLGQGYVERSYSPLKAHKYQVTCVRISPQSSMLATASVDGTAVLWNLHSGKKLYTMTQVNGDAIRVCRFAPDSSILVTSGDNGAICIWDLVHKSQIRAIFEHEGTTQSLAFTPDSQYLVSACSLEVIKIWYVQDLVDTTADCTPLARLDNAHDLGVSSIDINRVVVIDENNPLIKYYRMATAGNSNEIKLWTITSCSMPKSKNNGTHQVSVDYVESLDGHNSSVTCIAYDHSGVFLISCSLDKLIKIWDREGNCVATLEGHQRYVNCVTFSRDLSLVASGSTGSNDKLVLVWDLTGNLTLESELVKHQRVNASFASTIPELQLMENVENDDNDVALLEKIDDIADGAINSCCFSCNNILATGSGDKLVRLFELTTEEGHFLEELSFSPLEGHTYVINHIEFSQDGTKLASCSLDGCAYIWEPDTGEQIAAVSQNSLGVKVCRFSSDGAQLITAGDDEKASIWDVGTMDEIASLEGHLDAVTSSGYSPDNKIIATTSTNADFRLWLTTEGYQCAFVREYAHEYGIQGCDFSQNMEPVPNSAIDLQNYLLATCGNDSLVKLWRISMPNKDNELDFNELDVSLWRALQGHGGNVISVRFSANVSEIICSTATDRQARIWSVYSAECLYVLDHDSIVTCCSFSQDCSVLATGCLDKTLSLWKMPQQLVFQTMVSTKLKCRVKAIIDWTLNDVVKWLNDMQLSDVVEMAERVQLSGQKLLTMSEEDICSTMKLSDEQAQRVSKEVKWLKLDEMRFSRVLITRDIPHEFLCPITHEIMREPVMCSDGFTYEKNAICEWFMSGKFTSPLTNEKLSNTEYVFNQELREAIHAFLESEED